MAIIRYFVGSVEKVWRVKEREEELMKMINFTSDPLQMCIWNLVSSG
jgi:hypothetical protein